jgi:hypothetical protein
MIRSMARFGLVTVALVSALIASGVPAQSFSKEEAAEPRSVIRPNAKCAKANAKATVIVKGKTLRCKRSKGGYFWRVVAPPADLNESDRPTTPIQRLRVVPDGANNALFTMNQRFLPEIAQTFTLEQQVSLESLTLDPRCVTLVPLTYYSGPNQDHSLEEFTCSYPEISTTVTTSIYKRWQVQDSNLRRRKPTDLQSAPIGRSGNLPCWWTARRTIHAGHLTPAGQPRSGPAPRCQPYRSAFGPLHRTHLGARRRTLRQQRVRPGRPTWNHRSSMRVLWPDTEQTAGFHDAIGFRFRLDAWVSSYDKIDLTPDL